MHASTQTPECTAGESESLTRAAGYRHLVPRASSRSKGAVVSFGVWESPKEDSFGDSVTSWTPGAGDVWTIRRSTKTSFLSIQT